MDAPSDRVSVWTSLRTRSSETEWLDDLATSPTLLERNLHQLELLNHFLGGHQSLLRGVGRALRFVGHRPLRVVDVGCGNGDGLRALDKWCSRRGLNVDLIGLDLNPAIIDIARRRSEAHANVRFLQADAFGGTLDALAPDITTATLFCHHFPSTTLTGQLQQLLRSSAALVISDLHRHPVAHAGFRGLCRLAPLSPMTRHDGAVSIRRGFQRAELEALIAPLGARHVSIRWAFAFRYEVLLVR